jgi:hypothetical protein
MMDVGADDTWDENRKFVLEALARIEKRQNETFNEVVNLKVRVASISGIVALIVGAVSTFVTNLLTR